MPITDPVGDSLVPGLSTNDSNTAATTFLPSITRDIPTLPKLNLNLVGPLQVSPLLPTKHAINVNDLEPFKANFDALRDAGWYGSPLLALDLTELYDPITDNDLFFELLEGLFPKLKHEPLVVATFFFQLDWRMFMMYVNRDSIPQYRSLMQRAVKLRESFTDEIGAVHPILAEFSQRSLIPKALRELEWRKDYLLDDCYENPDILFIIHNFFINTSPIHSNCLHMVHYLSHLLYSTRLPFLADNDPAATNALEWLAITMDNVQLPTSFQNLQTFLLKQITEEYRYRRDVAFWFSVLDSNSAVKEVKCCYPMDQFAVNALNRPFKSSTIVKVFDLKIVSELKSKLGPGTSPKNSYVLNSRTAYILPSVMINFGVQQHQHLPLEFMYLGNISSASVLFNIDDQSIFKTIVENFLGYKIGLFNLTTMKNCGDGSTDNGEGKEHLLKFAKQVLDEIDYKSFQQVETAERYMQMMSFLKRFLQFIIVKSKGLHFHRTLSARAHYIVQDEDAFAKLDIREMTYYDILSHFITPFDLLSLSPRRQEVLASILVRKISENQYKSDKAAILQRFVIMRDFIIMALKSQGFSAQKFIETSFIQTGVCNQSKDSNLLFKCKKLWPAYADVLLQTGKTTKVQSLFLEDIPLVGNDIDLIGYMKASFSRSLHKVIMLSKDQMTFNKDNERVLKACHFTNSLIHSVIDSIGNSKSNNIQLSVSKENLQHYHPLLFPYIAAYCVPYDKYAFPIARMNLLKCFFQPAPFHTYSAKFNYEGFKALQGQGFKGSSSTFNLSFADIISIFLRLIMERQIGDHLFQSAAEKLSIPHISWLVNDSISKKSRQSLGFSTPEKFDLARRTIMDALWPHIGNVPMIMDQRNDIEVQKVAFMQSIFNDQIAMNDILAMDSNNTKDDIVTQGKILDGTFESTVVKPKTSFSPSKTFMKRSHEGNYFATLKNRSKDDYVRLWTGKLLTDQILDGTCHETIQRTKGVQRNVQDNEISSATNLSFEAINMTLAKASTKSDTSINASNKKASASSKGSSKSTTSDKKPVSKKHKGRSKVPCDKTMADNIDSAVISSIESSLTAPNVESSNIIDSSFGKQFQPTKTLKAESISKNSIPHSTNDSSIESQVSSDLLELQHNFFRFDENGFGTPLTKRMAKSVCERIRGGKTLDFPVHPDFMDHLTENKENVSLFGDCTLKGAGKGISFGDDSSWWIPKPRPLELVHYSSSSSNNEWIMPKENDIPEDLRYKIAACCLYSSPKFALKLQTNPVDKVTVNVIRVNDKKHVGIYRGCLYLRMERSVVKQLIEIIGNKTILTKCPPPFSTSTNQMPISKKVIKNERKDHSAKVMKAKNLRSNVKPVPSPSSKFPLLTIPSTTDVKQETNKNIPSKPSCSTTSSTITTSPSITTSSSIEFISPTPIVNSKASLIPLRELISHIGTTGSNGPPSSFPIESNNSMSHSSSLNSLSAMGLFHIEVPVVAQNNDILTAPSSHQFPINKRSGKGSLYCRAEALVPFGSSIHSKSNTPPRTIPPLMSPQSQGSSEIKWNVSSKEFIPQSAPYWRDLEGKKYPIIPVNYNSTKANVNFSLSPHIIIGSDVKEWIEYSNLQEVYQSTSTIVNANNYKSELPILFHTLLNHRGLIGIDLEYTSAICPLSSPYDDPLKRLLWFYRHADIYQVGLAPFKLSLENEESTISTSTSSTGEIEERTILAHGWSLEASDSGLKEFAVTSYKKVKLFFDDPISASNGINLSIKEYLERRLDLCRLKDLFEELPESNERVYVFHNGLNDVILLLKWLYGKDFHMILESLESDEPPNEAILELPLLEQYQRSRLMTTLKFLLNQCGIKRFYDTRLLYEVAKDLHPEESNLKSLARQHLYAPSQEPSEYQQHQDPNSSPSYTSSSDEKSAGEGGELHTSGYDALITAALYSKLCSGDNDNDNYHQSDLDINQWENLIYLSPLQRQI